MHCSQINASGALRQKTCICSAGELALTACSAAQNLLCEYLLDWVIGGCFLLGIVISYVGTRT